MVLNFSVVDFLKEGALVKMHMFLSLILLLFSEGMLASFLTLPNWIFSFLS